MSTGWTISIDATSDAGVTDDEVEQLVELFHPHRGALAIGPAGRFGVTFSIDADKKIRSIDGAAAQGGEIFRAALRSIERADDFTIVHLDARTFAEQDAELAQPLIPALVGVAELAELLGVSPQRASELRSRAGFPSPVAELKSGPVWVRSNVEHFTKTWQRTPGRPRKAG